MPDFEPFPLKKMVFKRKSVAALPRFLDFAPFFSICRLSPTFFVKNDIYERNSRLFALKNTFFGRLMPDFEPFPLKNDVF